MVDRTWHPLGQNKWIVNKGIASSTQLKQMDNQEAEYGDLIKSQDSLFIVEHGNFQTPVSWNTSDALGFVISTKHSVIK